MNAPRWFHCAQTAEPAGDALRRAVVRLYQAGRAEQFSLVVIDLAAELSGFDRLAARMGYSRVLQELGHVPVGLGIESGAVMALIARGIALPAVLARLRMRLRTVTPGGRPPSVWLERLPADLPTALELLDELRE